jgi:hypothetical protein
MSAEIARFLLRFQKMFQPTVHVLVPQVLFTYMVSDISQKSPSPSLANKELFRIGVWSGSIAMLKLAKPGDLASFWPKSFDAEKLSNFVRIFGSAAWYLFAGHLPKISTEKKLEKVLWIELREISGKESFYKIEVPEGINVWFFLAGAYEGATLTAFRMLGEEENYLSMWRPLESGDGIEGYYASREINPNDIARICIDSNVDFFNIVSWEDSSLFAEQLLGLKIPLLK